MTEKSIAVIGLGYVGLPLAVEFGKIREVLGYDTNPSRIEELKNGIDCTLEVTKSELELANYLIYSNDVKDLQDCGIYIITVPTPIDSANRPELTPLKRASEMVSTVLAKANLVIYESTVYPGCTEEICVPILYF